MIKEVTISIRINSRNYRHYKEKGYNVILKGINDVSEIEVNVIDVNKNSDSKITAICDICSSENFISVHKYWRNFYREDYNFYSCFKCKNYKKELTSIRKYGKKSFSQTDIFKDKFKQTCINKFGEDNPNKCPEIREKIKSTNLNRYGLTTPLLKEEMKSQNRIWMSSESFRDKSKKTLLEKYGVESYSKTEEFKAIIHTNKDIIIDKMKKTNLQKFGVDSYFKTTEYKNSVDIIKNNLKRVETCLSRYGVDNVSKDIYIIYKIRQTKINRGIVIADNFLSDWEIYKREVRRQTERNRKPLFQNWDGYDYYDNEYIKDNLCNKHTDRYYPTIDHKLSVFYGFINSISPEIISDINNLCITKRYINCTKNKSSDTEFALRWKSIEKL